MSDAGSFVLSEFPAHPGLGAKVFREPRFGGMPWYAVYTERHAADGVEGRLVSTYTSDTRAATSCSCARRARSRGSRRSTARRAP